MRECNAVVVDASLGMAAKELDVRVGDALVQGRLVLFALKMRGLEANVAIRVTDAKGTIGPATWYQICHDVLSTVVDSAGAVPWTSGEDVKAQNLNSTA